MRTEPANLDLLRLGTGSRSEAIRLATVGERVDNRSRRMETTLLLLLLLLLEWVKVEGRIVCLRLVSSRPLILISGSIDNSRLSGGSPGIGTGRIATTIPIGSTSRRNSVAISHCTGRSGWSGRRRRLSSRIAGRRATTVVARVVAAVVGTLSSSSSFTLLTRNLLQNIK